MPGTGSSEVREPLLDVERPVVDADKPLTLPTGTQSPMRKRDSVLVAGAVLAVFLVHFRPWQGGLLEDWGMALSWDAEGFSGFAARLPLTLARPLHLLPDYVGMALSDGGFVGYYAVLAGVAVAQLVATLWAVAPLTRMRFLKWAVALALALHPWWAAGDILRFLSAQVSVLCVVLWLGASIRFLATGRVLWAALLVVAPVVGLLSYQASAATIVLGSVLLALMSGAERRRQIALVLLTVGASVTVFAWSVAVVPRISPVSYESQLVTSSFDIVASLRVILRTVALYARSTAFVTLFVAVIVIALGLRRRFSQGQAWLLLVAIACAPLTALTYAFQRVHLNDPERVALPIGLMLWVVLCCLLPALSTHRLVRVVATAVLLAGTTIGALVGYVTWTGYAASQQVLIDAVQSVRKDVPVNAQLVVADQTGRYGDIYLLLPPHLNLALDDTYGPGADAILCTPAGVTRIQPTATLLTSGIIDPLATTPDCSTLLDGKAATRLRDLVTTRGTFKIYELPPPDSTG